MPIPLRALSFVLLQAGEQSRDLGVVGLAFRFTMIWEKVILINPEAGAGNIVMIEEGVEPK